jgi:hypothetical protein
MYFDRYTRTTQNSRIVGEALQEVDHNYGDEMFEPSHAVGKRYLAYHNLVHSREVFERSQIAGEALGLSPEDLAIAGIAASAHDVIQEGGRGTMERDSAEWLVSRMHRDGFSGNATAAARLAILGTEPLLDEDNMITGQKVTELEFSSKRAEDIAHAVAIADLGGLYQPRGPLDSLAYFQELQWQKGDYQLQLKDFEAYQAGQVALTETFRYSQPIGDFLFGEYRNQVIDYHKHLLIQAEVGNIASWHLLRDQAEQFSTELLSGKL